MKMQEKFGKRPRPFVEVSCFTSLETLPACDWVVDSERVKLAFCLGNARLRLVMSQEEALYLGKLLTSYGERKLEAKQ